MNSVKPYSLPYQRALITGASSGLGKTLSIALAKRGIPLLLTGRDRHKLEECAAQLTVPTEICVADLTVAPLRKQLIARMQAYSPDLIINSAGFGLYGDALSLPVTEQLELIEVNVKALVEISLEGARTLIRQGKKGTILNVSSAAAFFIYPSFALYAASKAFVNRFSEALDVEVAPQGVRVLTVCPGQIDTDFQTRASHGFPQKKTRWAMSAEQAAQLILKQIETQKPFQVIDRRYRLLLFLSFFLPRGIVTRFLRSRIAGRYAKN